MFFAMQYHLNGPTFWVTWHVALTFITNAILFPIAVYIAYRKNILFPPK